MSRKDSRHATEQRVRVGFYLPDALKRELGHASVETGQAMSAIVEAALRRHLARKVAAR